MDSQDNTFAPKATNTQPRPSNRISTTRTANTHHASLHTLSMQPVRLPQLQGQRQKMPECLLQLSEDEGRLDLP